MSTGEPSNSVISYARFNTSCVSSWLSVIPPAAYKALLKTFSVACWHKKQTIAGNVASWACKCCAARKSCFPCLIHRFASFLCGSVDFFPWGPPWYFCCLNVLKVSLSCRARWFHWLKNSWKPPAALLVPFCFCLASRRFSLQVEGNNFSIFSISLSRNCIISCVMSQPMFLSGCHRRNRRFTTFLLSFSDNFQASHNVSFISCFAFSSRTFLETTLSFVFSGSPVNGVTSRESDSSYATLGISLAERSNLYKSNTLTSAKRGSPISIRYFAWKSNLLLSIDLLRFGTFRTTFAYTYKGWLSSIRPSSVWRSFS